MNVPGRDRPANLSRLLILLFGGILFATIAIGILWRWQPRQHAQPGRTETGEPLQMQTSPSGGLAEAENDPVRNIPPPYPIPVELPDGVQSRPANSRDFPPEAEFRRIQEQQLGEWRKSVRETASGAE